MKILKPGIPFTYYGVCETCGCSVQCEKDEMFSELNLEWDDDNDYEDETNIDFRIKCPNECGCTDTFFVERIRRDELPKPEQVSNVTCPIAKQLDTSGIDLEVDRNFKLFYWISNDGDGSGSVHFTKTEQEAIEAEEKQPEGFAEETVSWIDLRVESGQILFREFEEVNGVYQDVWKPLNLS